MENKNAILLMLGILFLAVIVSVSLIFLETTIPVVLILALGVIYIIFIDLMLLNKPKGAPIKTVRFQTKVQPRVDPIYNNLLKTSIDLNDKITRLNERERQLKRIAEDAKKTIRLNNDVKKHIRAIRPQRKYVASILSNKFHAKNCKFTKLIESKNKVFFKTKNQALKQGFKPCKELKHN